MDDTKKTCKYYDERRNECTALKLIFLQNISSILPHFCCTGATEMRQNGQAERIRHMV